MYDIPHIHFLEISSIEVKDHGKVLYVCGIYVLYSFLQ